MLCSWRRPSTPTPPNAWSACPSRATRAAERPASSEADRGEGAGEIAGREGTVAQDRPGPLLLPPACAGPRRPGRARPPPPPPGPPPPPPRHYRVRDRGELRRRRLAAD